MDPGLRHFHPLVQTWFERRFQTPTEVQTLGWDAIANRRHALLSAPTGSGKTLAAFLTCIDALVRLAIQGPLDDETHVVYVSPLKALSNDITKNLREPLKEIAALADELGTPLKEIRIALRTGDTPASERAAAAKRPPHIWITTPESLFILLTSDSGRRALATVHTVIVDEIHAVADDKRGSHLALSIERLERLSGRPLLRIGCSATVSPLVEVGRFLVGTRNVDADGTPHVDIIDQGRRRRLDLALELPDQEVGPIATHEYWDAVLDRIAELATAHRTTIVFTNTRRLVERVAMRLSNRLGEDQVVAHHGSLARKLRLDAEQRLKNAEVRVCVATASLELGLDVGAIDLVCQIGSPRSVSVFLQRVGRSGHAHDRTPRGRLFPLTRDELVESVALIRLAERGELDALEIPPWPRDVLAQQIVATCAGEEWPEDDLFELMTRAWPYRDTPRAAFDDTIEMLSKGFDTSRGRRSAMLLRDGVNRRVEGRRGARLAAITSGGAIPDNADYDVIKEPEGIRVGRIGEDFAVESLAGDVFVLGNATWRIRRVESGRVRVEDAQEATPTVPFWVGEAPARTRELSHALSLLRAEVDELLTDAAASDACPTTVAAADELRATQQLMAALGLDEIAARQVVAYIAEGKRVLGVVPTDQRVVAERFFDESGGMQLVLHAPFGARINRAWGLALRKKFCRSFDFELQAAATDNGINLSLGPQHSFPLEDVFRFVHSRTASECLEQAVLPSPIFATRWRWTASRALALLRFQGGRKVPPPLQRMRADDLLAAVFPAQAQCQDNAPPGGDLEIPDHPLVAETMRDCLQEALDAEGLTALLAQIERGEIEVLARDTPQPSAFGHELLNAMPYAFLDDAPLEERRARAVQLRRALPEDERDLGRLDPLAIATATEDAWPPARDPNELHDALTTLVLARTSELERFGVEAAAWLDALDASGRIARLGEDPDDPHLAATEQKDVAAAALDLKSEAVEAVVRGRASVSGPFRVDELAALIGIPAPKLELACLALESQGVLLRGAFRAPDAQEWCDRRILARIHRATIKKLRREIEPVPPAVFLRFLARWQHVEPDTRLDGDAGLVEALEDLQGFEAAACSWESALLPARVKGYDPDALDRLCLNGAVVWGRLAHRERPRDVDADGNSKPSAKRRAPLTRVAPVTLALRRDLDWLMSPRPNGDGDTTDDTLSSRAARVRDHLTANGASFSDAIAKACGLLPTELEDALGELVASGIVSADGFTPLRRMARPSGRSKSAGGGRRASRFRRRTATPFASEGRWWLLDRPEQAPDHAIEASAAQLLLRYGVVFRDLLARESTAPPWRQLLYVLRRAEARGEVRGGRFIAGLVGEQFALPEAIDALRKSRREEPTGTIVVVSACDPLNLHGILTPGPKVPAMADNRVVLRDGVPVAWIDSDGEVHVRDGVDGNDGGDTAESIREHVRGTLLVASVR